MLPLPSCNHQSREILCFYANRTPNPQIVKITNIAGWEFERVVFPGKSILFQAAPEGLAEIYSFRDAIALHFDQIPCQDLQISDELITSLLSRLS